MVSTHIILRRMPEHIGVLGGKITKNFGVGSHYTEEFRFNYCFLTFHTSRL
jgi:hypothetical protein